MAGMMKLLSVVSIASLLVVVVVVVHAQNGRSEEWIRCRAEGNKLLGAISLDDYPDVKAVVEDVRAHYGDYFTFMRGTDRSAHKELVKKYKWIRGCSRFILQIRYVMALPCFKKVFEYDMKSVEEMIGDFRAQEAMEGYWSCAAINGIGDTETPWLSEMETDK